MSTTCRHGTDADKCETRCRDCGCACRHHRSTVLWDVKPELARADELKPAGWLDDRPYHLHVEGEKCLRNVHGGGLCGCRGFRDRLKPTPWPSGPDEDDRAVKRRNQRFRLRAKDED